MWQSRNIFIGMLPRESKSDEIQEFFSKYGTVPRACCAVLDAKVKSVYLRCDRITGLCRGGSSLERLQHCLLFSKLAFFSLSHNISRNLPWPSPYHTQPCFIVSPLHIRLELPCCPVLHCAPHCCSESPPGYGYVYFESSEAVEQLLKEPMVTLGGQQLTIKLMEDRQAACTNSDLFVGGLSPTTTRDDIHEFFSRFGAVCIWSVATVTATGGNS